MGKVRTNIADPCQALAQWVGRKLRNHDPMVLASKKLEDSHGKKRSWGKSREAVFRPLAAPETVYYDSGDGRYYKLSVTEVLADEYHGQKAEAVPMAMEA